MENFDQIQKKAMSLREIAGTENFSLNVRDDGSWYVFLENVNRHEGWGFTVPILHGRTPDEAILQCWEWAADPRFHLVIGEPHKKNYKGLRYNGSLWAEVDPLKIHGMQIERLAQMLDEG